MSFMMKLFFRGLGLHLYLHDWSRSEDPCAWIVQVPRRQVELFWHHYSHTQPCWAWFIRSEGPDDTEVFSFGTSILQR